MSRTIWRQQPSDWYTNWKDETIGPFQTREKARMWRRGMRGNLPSEQLLEATGIGYPPIYVEE